MKFRARRLSMLMSFVLAASTTLTGMGWQEKHHGTSESPRIIRGGKNAEVLLSDAMKKAIRQEVPDFKPWKMKDYSSGYADPGYFSEHQTPFAALGDFNGDGIIDAALLGQDKQRDLFICLLSTSRGFDVQILRTWPLNGTKWDPNGVQYNLGYSPKGERTTFPEEMDAAPFIMLSNGFYIYHADHESHTYYVENGQLIEIDGPEL